VIHIEGDIIDGKSRHLPLFNIHMTGSETLTEQIREIKEDTSIKAVVLRINSPGGSALAADIVWRELMKLRSEKPVVASLGTIAASGAYYIASAADLIYTEPTTLTGSIGAFYGKADISGLLDKLGISTTVFKRGEHADIQSWTRGYTPEEKKKLAGQLQSYYDLFIDRVVEGRGHGFTTKRVEKRAKGRIWSGADARHHLLADRTGGFQEALNYARALGSVARGTTIKHYPEPGKDILGIIAKKMGFKGREQTDILSLSRETLETLKAALPFAMADLSSPQARLPFAVIETP